MIPKKFTKSILGKVVLKANSDVGANTVILPGVTIGEGVALGANSLVLKSITKNKWSLYFGSPARFVKKRNKDNILKQKKNVEIL